jgi:hypothetical protein
MAKFFLGILIFLLWFLLAILAPSVLGAYFIAYFIVYLSSIIRDDTWREVLFVWFPFLLYSVAAIASSPFVTFIIELLLTYTFYKTYTDHNKLKCKVNNVVKENNNNLINKARKISLKLQTINNKEGLNQLNIFLKKNEIINDVLSDRFDGNEATYIKLNETNLCFFDGLEKYWIFIKRIQSDKWYSKQEGGILKQRFWLSKNNRVDANKILFKNEKVLLKLGFLAAKIISIHNDGSSNVKQAKENILDISKYFNRK